MLFSSSARELFYREREEREREREREREVSGKKISIL